MVQIKEIKEVEEIKEIAEEPYSREMKGLWKRRRKIWLIGVY
jgi:hypothetical protein